MRKHPSRIQDRLAGKMAGILRCTGRSGLRRAARHRAGREMSLDPDKRGIFVFREQRSRFPVVVIGAVPVPDNVPSNEIAEQIRDRLAKSGDRSEPAALRELNHKGRLHRILDYRRDVIISGFFFEYPNFVDYVAVRGKTA